MVTSRGLVRGLNRMPVNTDGPVFVSFDTLAACDLRPQHYVKMTHLWLDYEREFLKSNGVFSAGRIVEKEIVKALGLLETEVYDNTVRLHARDEIADGTLAHGTNIIGSMARVPFIFIAVISLGFIAMLIASADSRKREFAVLRAVGATHFQLAAILAKEAIKVAALAIALGLPGGALVGWLFTAATRSAMGNWGLPPAFAVPWAVILEGAIGAMFFALAVAIPTALFVLRSRR
jgi:putative ABC transport system permease protein